MNPTEHLAYWTIAVLFFIAFIGMYRRWARTGNPQVKFAGRIFLLCTLAMAAGYWLLP